MSPVSCETSVGALGYAYRPWRDPPGADRVTTGEAFREGDRRRAVPAEPGAARSGHGRGVAYTVVQARHARRVRIQRPHQSALSHRLAVHAADLRPGDPEPESGDLGRTGGARHGALSLPGGARHRQGAHFRPPRPHFRPRGQPESVRGAGHLPAARAPGRRRLAAGPRRRDRPGLSRRRRAGGAVRSALAAVLPRALLPVPCLDRDHRDGRRGRAADPGGDERVDDARSGQAGRLFQRAPARPRGGGLAQRRVARRDGHDAQFRRALARRQRGAGGTSGPRRRCRERARRAVEGVPLSPAIGGAGGRRLAGHQSAGDRRHHHRELDPDRAGAGPGRAGDRPVEGRDRGAAILEPAARADARAVRSPASG